MYMNVSVCTVFGLLHFYLIIGTLARARIDIEEKKV